MSLQIERVQGKEFPCLLINGRIDTTTSADLQKSLEDVLADAAVKKLALDFSAVQYVSSAGLRVLLMAVKTLKPRGGSVVLAAVSAEVQQVLKISGFQSFLTLVDTLEQAG